MNPMYCVECAQCSLVWRRVFPHLATQRLGDTSGFGVLGFVWFLPQSDYHEVWCPKVIGRDGWVREATGGSVQRFPPKNLWKKLVVVRKRIARETECPHYT